MGPEQDQGGGNSKGIVEHLEPDVFYKVPLDRCVSIISDVVRVYVSGRGAAKEHLPLVSEDWGALRDTELRPQCF